MVPRIRGEDMDKIVYVALDERPCNTDFPREIFQGKEVDLVLPPKDIMPNKKTPGNIDALQAFLLQETKDAFGLVVSIDTLLYGGLVPSRIHKLDETIIEERHAFLCKIKQNNPDIVIYGFQIIMRCPSHNGSDEEPSYYRTEGRKIHLNGVYKHKSELGILSADEILQWRKLDIKKDYLEDFQRRRNVNLRFDLSSIKSVKDGTMDFLILCQDDAGEYGYPAMDQEIVASAIKDNHLRMKVYAYSGADELGAILVARMVNKFLDKQPTFFLKYPSLTSPTVVPLLEDRSLDNTIKYQIISAGGIIVPTIEDADIVLVSLMGATQMFDGPMENNRDIDVMTNLVETFEFINWVITKKPVIIADLFFLNSGSLNVLSFIKENGLLMKLAAYAGWNTSSNALGTAIAQGIQFLHQGDTKTHREFLVKRYVEDIGYCNIVRASVSGQIGKWGMNYFNVFETHGQAAKQVARELRDFIDTHLFDIKNNIVLRNVCLPWKRMFEVGFEVEWVDRQ